MKKLVFTALAVVAFSGVSLANSIEVKNESAKGIPQFDLLEKSCTDKAIDAYQKAIDRDNDGNDDLDLLHDFLSVCY